MNVNAPYVVEMPKDARIVWYDGDILHQTYPSLYPHRKYCLTRPLLLAECGLESVITLTPNLAHICLHDSPDRGIPTFHLRNDGAKTACGKILELLGVVAIKVTAYDLDVYVAHSFDFNNSHLHGLILRILADNVFYNYREIKVIDRDKKKNMMIYNCSDPAIEVKVLVRNNNTGGYLWNIFKDYAAEFWELPR